MSNRRIKSKAELLGLDPSPVEAGARPPRDSSPRSRGGDLALVGGAYEGASRTNREIALWAPPLRSADAEMLHERDAATGRARDVLRNDAYVQSASHLHKDGIVGSMFLLNAKPEAKVLGLDETWEQEFQEEVETKFTLWAESPDNWPDAARMNTLTGLVRLAVATYLAGGEVLATAEWLTGSRYRERPFKTAIQMVEADRLSNPFGGISFGRLRGGIERDEYGAPLAYHIRKAHASDMMAESYQWKRVPVRKSWGRIQVIHILEQSRIDQSRGISEMVAALKEMRSTKHFRDIVLQNAVVNATYAATIESELPPAEALETIGFKTLTEDDLDPYTQWGMDFLNAVNQYSAGSKNLMIDGVRIPHLFPGTKLQLRPAGEGGPLGTEFEAALLRYIAANLNVSYEQLSRDYSQSNYSSVRAAMTETWKFMLSRKRMVADKFASHIYRLWFEEAVQSGQLETMKGRPSFYEGMNRDAYTACEWIGASRGQIDELKETQAAALRITKGLSTHEHELARLGMDWRKVFKQRGRENEILTELGLQMDPKEMQNMENATTGDSREPRGDGSAKETSDAE